MPCRGDGDLDVLHLSHCHLQFGLLRAWSIVRLQLYVDACRPGPKCVLYTQTRQVAFITYRWPNVSHVLWYTSAVHRYSTFLFPKTLKLHDDTKLEYGGTHYIRRCEEDKWCSRPRSWKAKLLMLQGAPAPALRMKQGTPNLDYMPEALPAVVPPFFIHVYCQRFLDSIYPSK